MEDEQETSYLRHRRKKSSMSLSCCFHGPNRRFDSSESSSNSSSPMMSPASSWFRSKGHHELPEVKGKSRNLMSRMGGRHARRHSGDFSYDPLSYALNFDTSSDTHFDDFTARLPVSPPCRRPSLSTQIRNLELPSPHKSAAAPKVKVSAKATEMPSPSPTVAMGGRGTVERTQATPSPSPTVAMGGRGTVERTQAVAREISVEY